jgi:hypothetical protein
VTTSPSGKTRPCPWLNEVATDPYIDASGPIVTGVAQAAAMASRAAATASAQPRDIRRPELERRRPACGGGTPSAEADKPAPSARYNRGQRQPSREGLDNMPSALRAAGLLIGLILILTALVIGRRGGNRSVRVLMIVAGTGLIVVSAIPDAVVPFQDWLGLSGAETGRITTVVVFSVIVAYFLLFFLVARTERVSQRVGRLIRALSAAQFEAHLLGDHLGGVLVVIPAYNEAETLPATLDQIPPSAAGLPTRVLVIDDASRDGTREAARSQGAHVVSHPVNGGGGAALQTGYLIAERIGVDVVVTLDADGQHDPREMERLIEPIIQGKADFVIGSRRSGSFEREHGADGAVRDIGIRVYSRMVNFLIGTDLTDVSNGYRAIRASRLPELIFTEEQFHSPELLLGVKRAGLRIAEVPVTVRRRAGGTSKKGGTLRYGFGFLRVVFRSWLR